MSPIKRYAKQQAKARQRRRLHAHERLERDKRQAQRAAEALHQALQELGLPEDLVAEIAGRLRSQQKLLGKMIGVMFPALFGCRTPSELCRVRGWDKPWPSRLLGALPRVAFDGVFRVVLHLTGDPQGAVNDGGDHLQSETLLALCRLSSPRITRTFMGC
jgi:hypothetical protein